MPHLSFPLPSSPDREPQRSLARRVLLSCWLLTACVLLMSAALAHREQTQGTTEFAPDLHWLLAGPASPLKPKLEALLERSETPGDEAQQQIESYVQTLAALPLSAWSGPKPVPNLGYQQSAWFRTELSLPVEPRGPAAAHHFAGSVEALSEVAPRQEREAQGEEWLLEIANPVLDQVDIYVQLRRAGEPAAAVPRFIHWRVGDRFPFGQRPIAHRNLLIPIEARSGDQLQVLMRVRSDSALLMQAKFWRSNALRARDAKFFLGQAAFLGFMFGMFLYNLILYISARERIYAHYVIWVLSITLFFFAATGLGAEFLWPDSVHWNDRAPVILLGLGSFAVWNFVHDYFHDVPGLRTATFSPQAISLGYALVLALGWFLPFSWGVLLAMVCALVVMCRTLLLSLYGAWQGYKPAYAFLAASLPIMAGGVHLILQRVGLVTVTDSNFTMAQIGASLQVVLLSLALAIRLTQMRALRKAAEEMQAFNRALEASNFALASANKALANSINLSEERSRALVEMKERLREEAEQRNRDKSRFLAHAVHDLKQPLQAVANALSPVVRQIRTGAAFNAIELVELAQKATRVMRDQIGGLMDLSRLESGLVNPKIEALNAEALVRDVKAQLHDYAQSKAVTLELELEPGTQALSIRSDRQLLRQVLVNLVSNSIKYADPGKGGLRFVKLTLSLNEPGQEACAWVHVIDNGLGIADEHLSSGAVFKPFVQFNNQLPETEKGVGLGLSIVSAVLALLPGHQLKASSQLGLGSQFSLRLPISELAARPWRQESSLQLAHTEAITGAYIWLVEDDMLVRMSTAALLDFHGVLHDDFSSLAELESCLPTLERQPDVLLSDFRLPNGKSALDVLRVVFEAWGLVPTVIISGQSLEQRQLSLEASAIDPAISQMLCAVLKKPVPPDLLLASLALACQRNPLGGPGGTDDDEEVDDNTGPKPINQAVAGK